MDFPMLAKNFEPGKHDDKIAGWYASEKLDGVRAVFDGKDFYSRNGNLLHAPWRIRGPLSKLRLSGRRLDGELYIGRGRFDECSGIVRRNDDEWFDIQYHVFDIIGERANFAVRNAVIEDLIDNHGIPFLHHVEQIEVNCSAYMWGVYEGIMTDPKAEGIMLKNPASMYQHKRSGDLLKVKKFHDAEYRCIGIEPGKGKYKGMIGALELSIDGGYKTVSAGSGLTDEQRGWLPEKFIGKMITIKYFELTKDGIPRFPIFKAIRHHE